MFDHQCTACGKHQLVFLSQVTSLANTAEGVRVRHTCWCGADQSWLTGKAAEARPRATVAA